MKKTSIYFLIIILFLGGVVLLSNYKSNLDEKSNEKVVEKKWVYKENPNPIIVNNQNLNDPTGVTTKNNNQEYEYKNLIYGFSFKFPSTLYYNDGLLGGNTSGVYQIMNYNPLDAKDEISYEKNAKGEWKYKIEMIVLPRDYQDPETPIRQGVETVVAGQKAVYYQGKTEEDFKFYRSYKIDLPKTDQSLIITMYNYENNFDAEENLLKTFKF